MTTQETRAGAMDRLRVGLALTAGIVAVGWVMAILPGPVAPEEARADSDSYKEFQRFITSPNSWERANAVRLLDPNVKKELDALLKVLETQEWYVRAIAIDVISGLYDKKLIEKLDRTLLKGNPYQGEAVALAYGKKGDRVHLPVLIKGLSHKKWPVRRSCAYALGLIPDKASVSPLMLAWKKEKDLRVSIRMHQALEKVTGQFLGPEIADWENWWIGAEADFVAGEEDEDAAAEAEERGFKAKEFVTRERGVELNYKTRGNGPPVFVMPEYGYNRSYLELFLRPLEAHAKIFYIDLPPADKVENLQRGAGNMPIYPVDQLVEAFEAIRKKEAKAMAEAGKKTRSKIVILGHGITCWIAIRYATKYPKSLAGMVLVSPFSGNQAFRQGLERIEGLGKQNKDPELEHYAQNLMIIDQAGNPKYKPKDNDEGRALNRKQWTLYFADHRESEITLQFYGGLDTTRNPADGGVARRLGQVLVPQFDVFKEAKAPVPTLVFFGPHALFTSRQDCQKIVKHYPNAQLVEFKRSSRMPFIEENAKLVKVFKKLLR